MVLPQAHPGSPALSQGWEEDCSCLERLGATTCDREKGEVSELAQWKVVCKGFVCVCGAMDGNQNFVHDKQVLYHWDILPAKFVTWLRGILWPYHTRSFSFPLKTSHVAFFCLHQTALRTPQLLPWTHQGKISEFLYPFPMVFLAYQGQSQPSTKSS